MRQSAHDDYDLMRDTHTHINTVFNYMRRATGLLMARAVSHDASKLQEPEKSVLDEFTLKLRNTTYGSDEYKQNLKGMGVGLQHHYENNPHHPEHFANGIVGMSLLDLLEMLCDWKAASLRHLDGDILQSIELNQARYHYSDELKSFLINTIKEMDMISN